jgi:hypothetical protein
VKFDDGKLSGKYVKNPNLIKIGENRGVLYMRTYESFVVALSSVKRYQAVMTAEEVQTLNERATLLLPMFGVATAVLILIYLDH